MHLLHDDFHRSSAETGDEVYLRLGYDCLRDRPLDSPKYDPHHLSELLDIKAQTETIGDQGTKQETHEIESRNEEGLLAVQCRATEVERQCKKTRDRP